MEKKYKMIDLFAGAGGLTYGFVKNGFEAVETVEFNGDAVKTYNLNYLTNAVVSDITDDKLRNEIKEKWKDKIDLVIGGFPCQGFSLAGKRSVDDPRNQLYNYTIDIIQKVNPKCFCLENVKGILSYKEKDGIKVIEKIQNKLKEIGYYTEYVLLNAVKFGVPQKRERVIFVGAKNENKVKLIIENLKKVDEKVLTVRDVIEDLENVDVNKDWNHVFSKHSEAMVQKIKNCEVGKSCMSGFSDAFRKLDYDKPSFTVKENHGGVHLHPKLARVLTPRELARLQSFPDNFVFVGSKGSVLKQIGNAVPCKMSDGIAKIIVEVMFNEKH